MLSKKVVSVRSNASPPLWKEIRAYLGDPDIFKFLARYTKGDGRWPKIGVILYLYGTRDNQGGGVTSPFKTFVARSIGDALLNGNGNRIAEYLKSSDLRVRDGMSLDEVLETMRRAITADLLVIDDVQLINDDPSAQSKLVDVILDRRKRGGFLILTGSLSPEGDFLWAPAVKAALEQRSIHGPVRHPRVYASARSAS